jgi:nucleoid DNA-binding protein
MAKRKTTKKRTTKKRKSTTETKPRTKSQLFGDIAEQTDLSRKEVASVFEAMSGLMKKDLGRRGPGMFTVPGLMKVVKVHRPRRPARKNVPNPFRPGEMMDVAARPATNVVKVRPLKGLKDMV